MDMIDTKNKQVKHSLLWRWLMENRLWDMWQARRGTILGLGQETGPVWAS